MLAAYDLAKELRIWDVEGTNGMLAQMPWSQFRTWLAYRRINPFGEQRGDLRSGIIASTIANCHRDPKRKPTPFRPSDFMYQSETVVEDDEGVTQEEWEETLLRAKIFARAGAFKSTESE